MQRVESFRTDGVGEDPGEDWPSTGIDLLPGVQWVRITKRAGVHVAEVQDILGNVVELDVTLLRQAIDEAVSELDSHS